MKNIAIFKERIVAGNRLKSYFKINKALLLIFGIIVLCALFTGIFTCIKYENVISIRYISDFVLLKLFRRQITPFTFFVYRIIFGGLILVCIGFFSKFKWCSFIVFPLIAYLAYSLGFNCAIFILLFGTGGIINVIIAIFPCQILLLLTYVFFAVSCIVRSSEIKRFGRFKTESVFLKSCLYFAVPVCLICALQALLMFFCYNSLIFAI